jgi:hypothetical protein
MKFNSHLCRILNLIIEKQEYFHYSISSISSYLFLYLLDGCVDEKSLEYVFCNEIVVPDMAFLGQIEPEQWQQKPWHQYAYTYNHCQLDCNCGGNFEMDFYMH